MRLSKNNSSQTNIRRKLDFKIKNIKCKEKHVTESLRILHNIYKKMTSVFSSKYQMS